MALAEWGLKHTCMACHCRFYDLQRDPAVCPKCDTVFDPGALFKTRRTRASHAVAEKIVPLAHDADFDGAPLDLEDVEELSDDIAVDIGAVDDPLLEVSSEEDPLDEVIENATKI